MMKSIFNFLFSFRLMALLLAIFAISIAIATFIEAKYGTPTAHAVVYDSLWFALLLLLAIINLTGTIIINRLYRIEKLSIFIFHLSFLFILIGAATTRFFGKDGYMHIREGETSNTMITDDVFMSATATIQQKSVSKEEVIYFSALGSNDHKLILYPAGQKVIVECVEIIPNAEQSHKELLPKEGSPEGTSDAIRLMISSGGQAKSLWYIAGHETLNNPVQVSLANAEVEVTFGPKRIEIPFSLQLQKFILERYPGSESPSWFESKINLIDPTKMLHEGHRIYMNNVLNYKGYRFYQSSYDSDEHGTILSVNFDFWGTFTTYLGYLLLAVGILFSLFNPNSHFQKLSRELGAFKIPKVLSVALLMILINISGSPKLYAQKDKADSIRIDAGHASRFGELLVQDMGGRIKPMNSISSELIRKITYKTSFLGQNSDQVLLGMEVFPQVWQRIPMIRVSNPEIQKILNTKENYISFIGILNLNSKEPIYLLGPYVMKAYQKKPAVRSKFDTDIIRLDERVNLAYQIYTCELLKIFPKKEDPNKKWYTPLNADSAFHGNDSLFAVSIVPLYFQIIKDAVKSKNWSRSNEALGVIHDFQQRFGYEVIPKPSKVRLEIFYNRLSIFEWLTSFYGVIGFILLLFQFLSIFLQNFNLKPVIRVATILILLCFLCHGGGLIARWFISGHAPWSNAYESLIYIAFATVFAGILFSGKSGIALSVSALLGSLILFVAHLNWMDPEITNLVPVLKSYWLLIHVAIITASYGFLALGALLAFINLVIMIFQTKQNTQYTGGIVAQLTMIIEMTLIVGLYMLTIGTFLGGVWANESWGHYWSWDPKETWALVSILVYAVISHMRMIPGLKGVFTFNLMALLGFSSVIMTYFGVNYYLTGLHSYAKGDPMPVPQFVYYSLAIITIITMLAWSNQRKFNSRA